MQLSSPVKQTEDAMETIVYWLEFGAAFGFSSAALLLFCKALIR